MKKQNFSVFFTIKKDSINNTFFVIYKIVSNDHSYREITIQKINSSESYESLWISLFCIISNIPSKIKNFDIFTDNEILINQFYFNYKVNLSKIENIRKNILKLIKKQNIEIKLKKIESYKLKHLKKLLEKHIKINSYLNTDRIISKSTPFIPNLKNKKRKKIFS